MVWLPSPRVVEAQDAEPAVSETAEHTTAAPSLNVTEPDGVPTLGLTALARAVNVIGCPNTAVGLVDCNVTLDDACTMDTDVGGDRLVENEASPEY